MSLSGDLLWQQRFRGLMPAAGGNASEDGSVVLVRHHEREARTYVVFSRGPDGGETELRSLPLERTRKFCPAPTGEVVLAMTDHDLYLFREGRKERFLAGRQYQFADAAFCPATRAIAAAYSDALDTLHGLAYVEPETGTTWTRSASEPVTHIAISPNGALVAASLQGGAVLAYDRRGGSLWEHHQPEPVSALSAGAGGRVVAGTRAGEVLAMDAEGGLRWRTSVGATPLCLAEVGPHGWIAVGVGAEPGPCLVILNGAAEVAWETELEAEPTGLAASPDGRYLLVTGTEGLCSLFELENLPGGTESRAPHRRERDLTRAREAIVAGDLETGVAGLASLLRERPHDVELAREWAAARRALVESYRDQARICRVGGHSREALVLLAAAALHDPWGEELLRERLGCRREVLEEALVRAAEAEFSGEWESARQACLETLEIDSESLAARETLARTLDAEAAALTKDAEAHAAAGKSAEAEALLRRACALVPSDELQARLLRMQAERALDSGIRHYEAGRMTEAAYQLKKALALAPENTEAARYLRYALSGGDDGAIQDRFSRLED